MKNSDTFYRIRIVLLTSFKLPILIQLDPSRDFFGPLNDFFGPFDEIFGPILIFFIQ